MALVSYVAETQRTGPALTYLPCISWAWSGSWPAPARSRPHPRALSQARTGLTHLGRVARVGRPQGAEGREEAGRPFPQSQAGGVARAQVKPIPASPGNSRCRDSRRAAL